MIEAPSDWEMALRIGKAADQVIRGLKESAPKKAMWGLSLVQMWDLTGRVDEVPDLGIVCTTTVGFPGSTVLSYVGMNIMGGGVGELGENGTTRTVIVFPNMLRVAANRKQIEAHGFLHHELAHILYGHDPDELYRMARTARSVGGDYFNHPIEIDAYFHQALSALVRIRGGKSWADCDLEAAFGLRDDFFEELAAQMPPIFRKYASAATMDALRHRADGLWEAAHGALHRQRPGLGDR